jgi:hypothetical protein
MAINQSSNFRLFAQLPLDDRTVVFDLTARDAIDAGQRYEGMVVFVVTIGVSVDPFILIGGTTNSDWQPFAVSSFTGIGNPNSFPFFDSVDPTLIRTSTLAYRDPITGTAMFLEGINAGTEVSIDRYVDPVAGNDSNNGTSFAPWATVQKALNECPQVCAGAYNINLAVGTSGSPIFYSEILTAPRGSIGGASVGGGTVVNIIGNNADPTTVGLAGSGDLFTNDYQGRNFTGTICFQGLSLGSDSSGPLVRSSAGTVVFQNCNWSQATEIVKLNLGAKAIFAPSTTGGNFVNVGNIVTLDGGSIAYLASGIAGTDLGASFIQINDISSKVFFGNGLSFASTNLGTKAFNIFNTYGGQIDLGDSNAFDFEGVQEVFDLKSNTQFYSGSNNVLIMTDCDRIGTIEDNVVFESSRDGSNQFVAAGTTPVTNTFKVTGNAILKSRISTISGTREIPYTWLEADPAQDYVSGNDLRYGTMKILNFPGKADPGNGGNFTTAGLHDFFMPLIRSDRPGYFSYFEVSTRVANGATGADVYTVYLNGSPTTMTFTILNGDFGSTSTNGFEYAAGDEIGIFVLFGSDSVAEDFTLGYRA